MGIRKKNKLSGIFLGKDEKIVGGAGSALYSLRPPLIFPYIMAIPNE
jgi:hypothetical protein